MSECCEHLNFNMIGKVGRLTRSDSDPTVIAYCADIRVECRDCKQPFEFFGLPLGFSHYQPTVSIDNQELRVPLVIPGTQPEPGLAGFSVTHTVFDEKEQVKQ